MFIILGRIAYGPFKSAREAIDWAEKQWPDEEHEPVALQAPN